MADSPRVFISYAREDLHSAKLVYGLLRKLRFRPMIDVLDLVAGGRWKRKISNLINEADAAVFLVSCHSMTKKTFIAQELDALIHRAENNESDGFLLIPVIVSEYSLSNTKLAGFHAVDFTIKTEKNFELGFGALQRSSFLVHERYQRFREHSLTSEESITEDCDALVEDSYQLARGTVSVLFCPDEFDIYVNKSTYEANVYHGKMIAHGKIKNLIYLPEDHSVIVQFMKRFKLDIGVKLDWMVRSYFCAATEVSIVRTKDGKEVERTTVPLKIGVKGTYGRLSWPRFIRRRRTSRRS